MANIHHFKLSLSTSHSEDFHSTRAEHISLWSFQIPTTGMWGLYHTSFQPAGEICAFYLKAFRVHLQASCMGEVSNPPPPPQCSNLVPFNNCGNISASLNDTRISLQCISPTVLNFAWTWLLCLIHRSSNSEVYVSSVIKYWHFGLVDGLNYQPKVSVFDKPGMRVNILQIAPLNINLAQKIIQLRTVWKLSFQLMLWLRCRRQFWRKVLDCWILQSLSRSEHQLIIDRPQASIFNNLGMMLNNQLSFWVIWWQ